MHPSSEQSWPLRVDLRVKENAAPPDVKCAVGLKILPVQCGDMDQKFDCENGL